MTTLSDVLWQYAGNPTIVAAFITGVFQLLTAICAAVAAAVIGRHFWNQEQLKARLDEALGDIEFLLEVERELLSHTGMDRDLPSKQKIREAVSHRGYEWTGLYTPGRAYRLRQKLKMPSQQAG